MMRLDSQYFFIEPNTLYHLILKALAVKAGTSPMPDVIEEISHRINELGA
jgi:hypothetical protein